MKRILKSICAGIECVCFTKQDSKRAAFPYAFSFFELDFHQGILHRS